MTTSTANTALLPPPPPPATGEHVHHQRTIQRQLARTSFYVRLVDLAASIAGLLIGVLAFLLLVACVDHWIVPLGWVGRTLALVVLVGGTLAYLVLQVGPLLVRAINPTYAARTIEEVTPTLKNSLINFLLLRQDRSGVKEVVFEAVEAKAAADIATVRVEQIVDRSRLIYAGYVLCGVMAVFAAYKILSPKDPFQTVARIVLPWANIARPSRVHISDVLPGDAEVYHGQVVAVSAIVSGVREGDPVTLLYSTADGQTVDRRVEMALSTGGLRYECLLPDSDHPSPLAGEGPGVRGETSGIQQNLTYKILAGDAQSPDYTLAVVAAPTIIVEKLDYQFPAYTKKPPQAVPQQGDIHALEGTRVTIHAVSNQPIKSAYLELDPGLKDVPPELVPLVAEGTRARGTLTLQLKADKQTPWHASYQVRFYNERGQRSQQPILHKIEVIRDLPPEVQILQPQKVRVEVPLDGEQTIEVRGVDPDFGLSSLRLEGAVGGDRVVNVELLDAKSSQPPQAIVPFVFRPRQHKLAFGDELKYFAIAADNRVSPQTGQPEPNIARTAEYTLVVVAPRNAGDRGPGTQARSANEGAPPDKPENTQARSASEGAQPNKPNDGTGAQQQPMPGNSSSKPSEGGGAQQPMSGGSASKPQEGAQPDQSQSGSQQSGDQQSGSQSGQQSQGSSGSQNQGQQGASQQGSGGAGSQAGSPQSGSPMNDVGSQAAAGQGSASGKPSGNSQQPSGQQGDAPADASGTPSGSGGKAEKAHEGQLVEELIKQLQKEQGQPGQGGQSTPASGAGQSGSDSTANQNSQAPSEGGLPSKSQGSNPSQSDSGSKPNPADSVQGQPSKSQKPSGNEGQSSQPPQGQGTDSQGTKGQPNQGANSGQPMGNSPASAGQSGANDQKPQPGQPPKSQGDKTEPKNRLPDDQQGQNPSQQPGSGNSGGASQGASKTDQGQQSQPSQGEKRDPGAGQNGTEGAGSKSADKTGSGQGQEANRDKPKSQQPESGSAQQGEPSPPSNSKRQSDSQGGQSGDQSGGGKQGAGQSAGQEGNDSTGNKSAADQGAGAANQTGSGETGSKAGGKEQASSKTGQSGEKAGDGSQSRSASEGKPGNDSKSGPQPGDGASKENKNNKGDGTSKQPGNAAGGPVVNGGGDGNRPETNYGKTPEAEAADAANLEYARQATDLALQKLRDQEHDPDPALLEKLGWSKDDLAEFLRRWDGLKKSAGESPDGKRELDEALKSLGLRNPANRQRSGGAASDNQRDLRDSGDRTAPPASYRDLFDAFRKGASRSAK